MAFELATGDAQYNGGAEMLDKALPRKQMRDPLKMPGGPFSGCVSANPAWWEIF